MKRLAFLSMLLVLIPVGAVGADQETESQAAESTDRFDIITHNFTRDGNEVEAFIKIGRFTGQTWKLDGSMEMRWKVIPEQKESEKPMAGGAPRYTLYYHDFTKDGKDLEILIRFDGQTGKTWRWSDTEPAWVIVDQDK
ncbi:MAG TPA: hypothetical protein VGX68_18260 [Thermoanaerobaculia bacterium]|jgi:hypothetical protein|nr:hypothetical protein [Thermoanaerobaculia bacterium]